MCDRASPITLPCPEVLHKLLEEKIGDSLHPGDSRPPQGLEEDNKRVDAGAGNAINGGDGEGASWTVPTREKC